MARTSKIQWTNATWNPWHGCKKVSEGCKFCYMYRDKNRYGLDASIVMRSKTKFYDPSKWEEPKLIFTCSWSDWFIKEADDWRAEAWEIIKKNPQHTFQILTKRPERVSACLPKDWNDGYKNVWLGVSVETSKEIERIQLLNNIPSYLKFVSFEPLLSNINWDESFNFLDWIIIGGESGNNTGKYLFRAMELSWMENLIHHSTKNSIKCFVKQLGSYQAKRLNLKHKNAENISEWNLKYQIQEIPNTK